jgi:hypothetical protein
MCHLKNVIVLKMTVNEYSGNILSLCSKKYHTDGIIEQWLEQWALESGD